MLDKTYQPQAIEDAIYGVWERREPLPPAPRAGGAPPGKPYAIVIPPPNVTGSLHMGHALNNTLQDILSVSSACAATTCCGSPAPTMPASPRRWWSSAR